jgi:hypothetical protein
LLYRRFQRLLCQKFQLQRTSLVIHVRSKRDRLLFAALRGHLG